MPYLLTTRTIVPLPIERVFACHADAGNLARLTPPWLRFRVDTPLPLALTPGARLDYRFRLHGWPIRWQSEISEWDPPHRFVDEQRHGPYRWWIHTHRFAATPDGVEVEDLVDYDVPFGRLAHVALVGRDLRRIFGFRARALREALGLPPEQRSPAIVIVRR
jgi:ligand-binding SRPBCC domain-containing protein